MSTVLSKFKEFSENSLKVLNETFNCRKAEPYYVAVLKLVKENPQYREEFIDAFLSVIFNKNEPWELVQFCMRELQWEEVKESIIKLRDDSSDLRFVAVMNDILAVYEDNWEDEDLYIYYLNREH